MKKSSAPFLLALCIIGSYTLAHPTGPVGRVLGKGAEKVSEKVSANYSNTDETTESTS